jgi:glycosyltransferase involved in cell wall biosynthesis
MKVGIDAKWYFEGPPSGKRVVKNLVDQILQREDNNEYIIFLNRNHRNRVFPIELRQKKITSCYVWAGNNLLSNIFVLPFFSKRFKLQALLYQNFISPWDKAKKVAYIHDVLFLSNPEFYTIYERLYFSPLRLLTKFADSIITVSEEEKKRLLSYQFTHLPSKISVAHHGVDSSFAPRFDHSDQISLEIRNRFNLPQKYLLYVGRLNLRKNIDNLLRAIPLLRNDEIKLVIVGAVDWKGSNHIKTIEKLGIKNRVIFTGAIYDELGLIYSLSILFCFPSLAESFGLPPLEAMASGVPVVVSNTTSLPEVCGEAGNYVDPTDPSSIASVINGLLQDEELYAIKRRKGLNQAKKFTWENAANTVIDCIEKTVNDRLI